MSSTQRAGPSGQARWRARGARVVPRRPHTPMEGSTMLTLTRSVGESIRIGEDIEVYVVEVRGGTVRLGFKAPREVAIHR
ncbi:carbon storage regulator, partial [Enterococcus faecalis]|uniref:carbon storage regulator n=1 Tax=Enterococcus faecalis TaxID=1351 RepID=UPI003D6BE602